MSKLQAELLAAGFIAGNDLGRDYEELAGHMLIALTEQRTKEEIDQFVHTLGGLL
ncbi:putative glycine dehydrogenase (decarboxylating) subunit 1 [compost metagenome]